MKLIIPLVTSKDPKYVKMLKEMVKIGNKISRDPYIISGFTPENIIVLDFKDGSIHSNQPDFNTYGASVNKIQMKIFNRRCTINKDVYEEMRTETDIDVISYKYGDSVEKTLYIVTLLNAKKG